MELALPGEVHSEMFPVVVQLVLMILMEKVNLMEKVFNYSSNQDYLYIIILISIEL